ncbi:hypothetical protein [Rhizobium favelukesii]|uniref:Uncharacterized protein n=1 Tax=Rhizobium favelukesii TaxID=348824 RepID=W6RHS9_9HYPH|nr:hypothetical protein [Rhizobium favelukesii]MCS0463502.1 hypothetical protein [Rhizobium favelukesii]CDM59920.1 hypothetical protein LPU83_pLPU83a_0079 [Rhizobium favelukesii]
MAWTVKLQDRALTITTEAFDAFIAHFVRDEELLSRMSESWWRDIFVHMIAFGIDPTEVIDAVHDVEAGKPNSDVTVTEFKDESLKALWHKHYFSARYLPANIFPARGRYGLNTMVDEILDPVKYQVITPQAIDELAQAVATLPVEKRNTDGKITGKWVIFTKNDGKNYYLGLARTISDLQQDFDL